MKGEKDEEKPLDPPLFPRIHISEAEKGGPRAPPRNKMALCEPLTIPSNRFSSGSMSMLPLPSGNVASFVPAASSPHVGSQKKSPFSPFSSSPGPPNLTVRTHPPSSVGVNLRPTLMNPELRYLVPANYQTLASAGHIPIKADHNLFQPTAPSFISSRPSTTEKIRERDYPRLPSFTQFGRGLTQGNARETLENLTSTFPGPNTSGKLQTGVLPRDRNAGPDTTGVLASMPRSSSLLVDYTRLRDPRLQSHKDYKILGENKSAKEDIVGNLETPTRKRSASMMEGPSSSIQQLRHKHSRIDRSAGLSDTSVGDSVAGFGVSPDDVVGVIGQKRFWKARREIDHQQRILAVQIFELHRLMKVQRLVAESPEMLFDDNFSVAMSSKYPPMNELMAHTIEEPSSATVQVKADARKSIPTGEHKLETNDGKRPPLHNDPQKGFNSQQLTPKPCPQALISPPIAADAKFAPLGFHLPPGNQWLIPVRSPSEGLIYKPYAGPCPPTPAFPAPVYGSCGPMSLTGGDGNFLNAAYCVPPSNQGGAGNFSGHAALGQTYIQPYAMPKINAPGSSSTVERISSSAKHQTTEQDSSVPKCDTTLAMPLQNSCNIPSPSSRTVSDCGKGLQGSKGTDLQGSTASSPPDRNKGDALSLFPITPSVHVSDQVDHSPRSEQPVKVIKVVPHNPTSASESAARIFQAIQDERKQS